MIMKINLAVFILAAAFLSSVAGTGENEFTYKNSYDGSTRQAACYIPDNLEGNKKYPLLVVAHYMSGDRFTARRLGYNQECEKRKWLLVCPELHGKRQPGQNSMAALEAQHDIIDAIDYMKKNYAVDDTRIYISGRSMGGMLTQIMMAKYPDLFAAGVAGEGISDLTTLKSIDAVTKAVKDECGDPDKNSFEYRRRSSINYASNFAYAPLIMWHGTNDIFVQPEQSETLYNEIKKYNRFQDQVCWLNAAAHCPANYTSGWVCDKLQYYANAGDVTRLRTFNKLKLVTDEDKKFFWLRLVPAENDKFGQIDADIDAGGILNLNCNNLSKVEVDLNLVSRLNNINACKVESNQPLTVEIYRGSALLCKDSGSNFTMAVTK